MILLNALSYLAPSGLGGVIWLIVLILVFKNIWTDANRSDSNKIVWSVVVFFLPVLGVILWWLFGRD